MTRAEETIVDLVWYIQNVPLTALERKSIQNAIMVMRNLVFTETMRKEDDDS